MLDRLQIPNFGQREHEDFYYTQLERRIDAAANDRRSRLMNVLSSLGVTVEVGDLVYGREGDGPALYTPLNVIRADGSAFEVSMKFGYVDENTVDGIPFFMPLPMNDREVEVLANQVIERT